MGFSAKLSSLLGLAVGRCRMRAWWAAGRAPHWAGLSLLAAMGLLGCGLPASWAVRATTRLGRASAGPLLAIWATARPFAWATACRR